ncbi:MAG TPA: flagellar hook-length control protein [Thermoanaerobaculia bacterium]|nr:flagellar hook-length control protein [Thermoanaerobaculia bacterium]
MTKIAITLTLGLALAGSSAVCASGGRGMTWTKDLHNSTYSVDHVGCYSCDPKEGDTLCSTSLPVLCVRNDASPNPGVATDFYNGWIAGHIHLTPPVQGTSLSSLAAADDLCVSYFGPGYQIAEFHHPAGGWHWYAYGDINNASHFWVSINDQAGNCWDP